ncbi:MAG: hypothetical protein P4L33_01685 [Capsulimonadaceae bacterium]|nr:hypothetical protein [Capsulimonadaceae bacterium]
MYSIVDLTRARIVASPQLTPVETQAITMLVEEVERRTGLTWQVSPGDGEGPAISIRRASGNGPADGFRLTTSPLGVEILGNDERGTLFGVGRLIRELRWARWSAGVPDGLEIETSPAYPLRGHQVGYRPKVNTYDGWTPAIFEQYVRDLILFGCNAIELMPPRTDDEDDSPHFHLPKLQMMVEMARIVVKYGLDLWVWYPALDGNYADPAVAERALAEWENVLRRLPPIAALHIPGGDPGHTEPKVLFAFLAQAAAVLRRHHAYAQIWLAPQCFDAAWHDQFISLIEGDVPWLHGIVYGPWTRVSLPDLRSQVPARYPVRYYPDVTHSTHSEFTAPQWDVAFAVTQGREIINPQPVATRKIFEASAASTIGFVTYSEGVHDDLNKAVWSGVSWDPDVSTVQIVREYVRCYISSKLEEPLAQAIFALEENWRAPLIASSNPGATLRRIQAIERDAAPQMRLNWRFQQILYRGYYDAYVHQRLIAETAQEQQAIGHLRQAQRTGTAIAMTQARAALDLAITQPPAQDLRARVFELAEALYQSIRMQLSVDRYAAIAVSRGATLDTVDSPLNNRVWLGRQIDSIQALPTESERLAAIDAVLGRSDPGPAGFYDDLGNPFAQPHLVLQGPGFDEDPGAYRSVRYGYTCFSGGFVGRTTRDAIDPDGAASFLTTPAAWWTWAETRYETPLTMYYDRVDPTANYLLRVVIAVERTGRPFRLIANDEIEIHPWISRPRQIQRLEFEIPKAAVASGTLTLRWYLQPGGGSFDSSMAISEVLLIRKE